MRSHRRKLLAAALSIGMIAASWALLRRDVLADGSVVDVYCRIRHGMSREEMMAVLDTMKSIDSVYYRGVTRDGRSFSGGVLWRDLPPAGEIEYAEVEEPCDSGGVVFVHLGPGGKVIGKRLEDVSALQSWSARVGSLLR